MTGLYWCHADSEKQAWANWDKSLHYGKHHQLYTSYVAIYA